MNIKNNRLISALNRSPVDCTPIWIMRQAGRYLPEYRKLRAKAKDFLVLCKNPELACEVTLQPLKRFDLDAGIIFSDILTIPDAMGLGLSFVEGKGPIFQHKISNEQAVNRLALPEPDQLSYVYDAIRLVKGALNERLPLIGFTGSPWTLAAYMVEGKSSQSFTDLLKMKKESPIILHKLLNTLTLAIISHLQEQLKAGADVLMIFDTWGGLLDKTGYEAFSLKYLQMIIHSLKNNYTDKQSVPIILFTKGGGAFLESMLSTDCTAIGIDWNTALSDAKKRTQSKVALQGNLNPAILLESESKIIEGVKQVLADYGNGSGHIFNLGHGITPGVDPLKVTLLIDAVHTLSKTYHQPDKG